MNLKTRTLGCLAGVAAATVLAIPLTAVPAQAAAPWWSDPGECTGFNTAVSRVVSNRTVEVRYGWCNRVQHAWGRILGYDSSNFNERIRFEVDLNSDGIPDGVSWYRAVLRNYTAAYPTSPATNRRFRACFVTSSSATCNSSNGTAWWW